ncbi:galactose/methyl galaxtoside transporter ATP-binding protein [compost metagenome]
MLRYIVELRNAGAGIVLISEELEELLNLSDRIAVLYEGKIMDIVENDHIDIENIGLLMGGRQRVAEEA